LEETFSKSAPPHWHIFSKPLSKTLLMLRKAKKALFLTFFEKKVRPKNLIFYNTVL